MNAVVVVPCFNEEQRLELERFEVFRAAGVQVKFVDDGSRDGTKAKVQAFVDQQGGDFSLLALERNVGKAEAVRQGMRSAIAEGARIVGYLDADLATPPHEMLRIVEAIRAGADVALGSRISLLGHQVERKPHRHYLGRIFATAASLTLGLRVYDTQCGAKAFAVRPELSAALAEPFQSRWVFDVELLERLVHDSERAPKMVEIPLHEWRDVKGSKLGPTAMARAAGDLVRIALRRRRGH